MIHLTTTAIAEAKSLRYSKPPLREALCEIRFNASLQWDWTIPGLFYDRVKDQYPKKRQENFFEVMMEVQKEKTSPRMRGGISKMQFLSDDESSMVQVGQDVIVVNTMKNYENWSAFEPRIADNLHHYVDVAKPKSIARIGLRYINEIRLPDGVFKLEDYFAVPPQVPPGIPDDVVEVLQQVLIPIQEGRFFLRISFGTMEHSAPEANVFLLDLDCFTMPGSSMEVQEASLWLQEAHRHVENAFFASCTEKTHKEVFGRSMA